MNLYKLIHVYAIATFDCKFKTNQENIENMLLHYGLRKIQSSLYAGELENNECETLVENINEIIKGQRFDNSDMSKTAIQK